MSVRKRHWTTRKGENREAWVVDFVNAAGDRQLATFDSRDEAEAYNTTMSDVPKGRPARGAWGEMMACCWLLGQGYEVYRNVCPAGSTDIVATKGGEFFRLDVKCHAGAVGPSKLKPRQAMEGVRLLIVKPDGTCCMVTLPQKATDEDAA
jgi:hypothetical protein